MAVFCIAFAWTSAPAQVTTSAPTLLPELGDSSGTGLSPQVERRIGEEAMREIRRDPAYVDDPEVSDYLNTLGMSLVTASSASKLDFQFFLIQDPMINAFAMPGGFVGTHTGLILAAQSESELASVLAHEVSHVTQRHIARGLGKQNQLSVISIAGALLGILASRSNPQGGQAIGMASQAGAIQAQLGYSREFEREADRVGFDVLQRAGFDVSGMVSFFERLQKASRLHENNAPSYLQAHPLTVERISDMQNRIQQLTYRQRADHVEFHLVRAKLRAEQGAGVEAVAQFELQIAEKRFGNEGATHYGLANAFVRTRNYPGADRELALARRLLGRHPMLDMLAGRFKQAQGDLVAAHGLIKSAVMFQPNYRPLQYALLQSMQRLGMHEEALIQIAEWVRLYPSDAKLYGIQAASYAASGKVLLQHQAQAEVYYLQGATQAAIDQLQIALKAGDGNYYQLSSVEARLRQLRGRLAEDAKNR